MALPFRLPFYGPGTGQPYGCGGHVIGMAHKNGFSLSKSHSWAYAKDHVLYSFPSASRHSDERAHIIRETKRPVHNCVGKEYHCKDKDKEN